MWSNGILMDPGRGHFACGFNPERNFCFMIIRYYLTRQKKKKNGKVILFIHKHIPHIENNMENYF